MLASRYFNAHYFPARYFPKAGAAAAVVVPSIGELLSAADIADLTALDLSGMPDTCTITTTVIGDDGGGGQTETTSTATSICRFVARTGREVSGDQLREQGDYFLYVPKTVTIPGSARVTFGSRTFQVIFTPPLTNYSTSRVVGLKDA